MGEAGWELLAVFFLILANGFFSAAEIALVSIRKSRLAQLIAESHPRAPLVAALKEDPGRFLATVQIGVTVISSMASVIGGAAAITYLSAFLAPHLPESIASYSDAISLTVTVAVISYFTLVLGELTPKSFALRHSERVAFLAAVPVSMLAKVAGPLVRLLTGSTDLLLRLLAQEGKAEEVYISEEEVKHMVHEGTRHGIFDEAERQLIHSVFEFTDTSVRDVMVPRSEVHAVPETAPLTEISRTVVETGFSRLPVYKDDLDHVIGIVHIKDVLRELEKPQPASLALVIHQPYFVPDSMQISDVLRELQSRRVHMALVVNEFGTLIGLLTIEDLLEEIVGEIRDEFDTDEEQPIQELPDGSILVQGSIPLTTLQDRYGIPFDDTSDYRTIAGFVLARLKRFPKGGEAIVDGPFKMTVVVLDGRRLRKIRVEGPLQRQRPAPSPAT